MILARKFTERGFDLVIARVPSNAKDFVVIAVAHNCSKLRCSEGTQAIPHQPASWGSSPPRNDIFVIPSLHHPQHPVPDPDWDPLRQLRGSLIPGKQRRRSFE
jgi:hypothetical protein